MIAWWVTAALAAPWWEGDWGIDPSRSDDPSDAIARAVMTNTPTVTGTQAAAYAPDGGAQSQEEADEARMQTMYDTIALLGKTGRVVFAPTDDGLSLSVGDAATDVVPGRKWLKLEDPDGSRYRLRLFDLGDRLVVERRYGSTSLVETWMAPDDDPSAAVVVVQVQGGRLGGVVEFRRIYRKI